MPLNVDFDETLPKHFEEHHIKNLLNSNLLPAESKRILKTNVFIAGTGPVAAAYARIILEAKKDVHVIMADIGSIDNPVVGGHHKNNVKYQRDIDLFVNVIKGALQPISVPRQDNFIPTLGGQGWRPPADGNKKLIFQGNNPDQQVSVNLGASAVTRTVGGMATHWTCACPNPHKDEREENPIEWPELKGLLQRARTLLKVSKTQYDNSIRQTVVKNVLKEHLGVKRVESLPLAVERRGDNRNYVTWSSSNTIWGPYLNEVNELLAEHRVTKVVQLDSDSNKICAVLLRDLNADEDKLVIADDVVLCCGAVPTPQILFNSDIKLPDALGHYLCEQSLAFCQIVLKKEYIDAIQTGGSSGEYAHFKKAIEKHMKKYKLDPLPIPFTDPEPQVTLPYSTEYPWHVQIHRDAFSYGEVGPRADSRVVVDLRWFGAQKSDYENRVEFSREKTPTGSWIPYDTDIYGMPQPTFRVRRSETDLKNDQKMMEDMTKVANILGSYLPGSYPQFMEPGLALHITGTTRIGKDSEAGSSVADKESRVLGFDNLYVGGNGCIRDSTACNPTLTSVAIAIKGARAILRKRWPDLNDQLDEDESKEQQAADKEEEEEAKRKGEETRQE